jgi:hypothetical protein
MEKFNHVFTEFIDFSANGVPSSDNHSMFFAANFNAWVEAEWDSRLECYPKNVKYANFAFVDWQTDGSSITDERPTDGFLAILL